MQTKLYRDLCGQAVDCRRVLVGCTRRLTAAAGDKSSISTSRCLIKCAVPADHIAQQRTAFNHQLTAHSRPSQINSTLQMTLKKLNESRERSQSDCQD